MFRLILAFAGGILSVIGWLMFAIVVCALLELDLTGFPLFLLLGCIYTAMILSGVCLDRFLRKKYHCTHKKMFSILWTVVSITEMGLLPVISVLVYLKLIPTIVLVADLLIYLCLAGWILWRKIRKVQHNNL